MNTVFVKFSCKPFSPHAWSKLRDHASFLGERWCYEYDIIPITFSREALNRFGDMASRWRTSLFKLMRTLL
ncbi:unnamed protein product [Nippostrongylus brasiliensis]|uniref:Phage protein n=1 Tax=Nippostrongylus brasiliensis TaxID=27835 RepID=A0A0N4YXA0_NIPBR|nr:unnamed protein product [Nippostrongylus brasiliensis]